MGNNLILPDRVTIQLINAQQHALKVEGVLFRVHFFARVKNDFNLQPFATNAEGLVIILRTEIEANIADHYATSLMDHHAVDDCFPTVEISMLTQEDISRAIEARKIWSSLLPGERERWASLDELLKCKQYTLAP